ncbi:MAG: penicillin-binding protein 1A [Thermodesulfobacteriota bacterium]
MWTGKSHKRITSDPLVPISGSPPLLAAAVLGVLLVGFAIAYFSSASGLPESVDRKSYQPKTASVFYAGDGSVLGMFYNERRFPVTLDAVPKHVQDAFVAVEDARFFSHSGIDPVGIMRALIKNLQMGNFVQGGSTITQQTARSILLTRERTIYRKLREMILALRIERNNSKVQILETYLNEIYLGRGAYGIEAAAQSYYKKGTSDLTLSEAAYLAGLAANPSKYSPERGEMAEARRKYALDAMLKLNSISQDDYEKASKQRPVFATSAPERATKESYFTEAARRYVISKHGEKALYEGGLQVWTTVDTDLQNKAEEAILKGVRAWEQRHGRPPGLVKRLSAAEVEEMKSSPPETDLKPGSTVQAVVVSGGESRRRSRRPERKYELTVMLKGGQLYEVETEGQVPYRKNDLLTFRVLEMTEEGPLLEHDDLPPVQGALVSIENATGYVKVLVGGNGGDRAGFNRALQAFRQPGSAFKPIIYSAALEWGRYDPRTTIIDEPIAVKSGPYDAEWIPENPDGSFQGPISVRDALVRSRNVPAVKVMMDLGPEAIGQMARNMGIKSPVRDSLTSALGASEISPLELTSAYSVFPNMGVRVTPVLIRKVTDRHGNVLEDNTVTPLNVAERARKDIEAGVCVAAPKSLEVEQKRPELPNPYPSRPVFSCKAFESERTNMVRVMRPQTAYLMLSMLREVTTSGTASYARRMGRSDIGGKTGSTNDYSDAWFIGFTPGYTTGVWIGHDSRISLGTKEYGAKAALPVWMEYMSYALRREKPRNWPTIAGTERRVSMAPCNKGCTRCLREVWI